MAALNAAGKMDKEIAAVLNREGFVAARGCAFQGKNVWLLRQRWGLATVKINGVSANPPRWPDGSYSVQGAAAALGITPQTVFDYLGRGLLHGRQLTKGQPWQIDVARPADRAASRSRATHQAIDEGGIMRTSASERLTGALLDRLTHHVHILEMNGESYRLQASRRRRSGLPAEATAGDTPV